MDQTAHARVLSTYSDRFAVSSLQDTLLKRTVRMAKEPTNLPRWTIFLTYGALILTIVGGAVAFGRGTYRIDKAVETTQVVPQLQTQLTLLQNTLNEISKKQDMERETVGKRLDALERDRTNIATINTKVDTLAGQMGSVWALAQSDSNKISRLEGMILAMQNQQKEK